MQRNGHWIRRLQWVIVLFYALLVIVPALLPLPDENSRVLTNLTVFAQFMFWGIWWPFVLISMVLMGRAWCGILCPEGALSEWTSGKGLNRAIPHWMRWGGWPFVAFAITTIYGQLVSVYQYPKAVLLVLGGSTVAAIVVGFLYGREKRIWCKYLCPVNGVFGVLSKLAPIHFKVDAAAWRRSYDRTIPVKAVNCAPLVAMRRMEGTSDCHMCGRCNNHRNAIELSARSPNHEIVQLGSRLATGWEATLILFGLLGIAIGAFQWMVNPHFIAVKQHIAEWLIDRNVMWPLAENAPWWLLTNYPDQRDVFSWLDGGLIAGYIVLVGTFLAAGLAGLLSLATVAIGPWQKQRFYHLCQALIPLAGCGVFLGLSALTVTLLKNEGISVFWANDVRLALLVGANLWSLRLALGIFRSYASPWIGQLVGILVFGFALAMIDYAWALRFWVW